MTDQTYDPGLDLEELFRAHGYEKKSAWVEARTDDCETRNDDSDDKTTNAKKPRTAAAERKAAQRDRDRERGWAECHAKAPDDEDARKLISLIASAIGDPEIRAAFWITVENHRTAMIGAKVIGLSGLRKLIINALLRA